MRDVWLHKGNGGSVSLQFYGYVPDGQVSWTQRQSGGDYSGNNSSLDTQHGDVFDYYPDGSLKYGAHQVNATGGWPGQQSTTADSRVADGNVSYATPTASSTYSFGYVYAAAGNRTQASQMGQPTIPYSEKQYHPGEHCYAGFAYDANGNTTNASVGWT